MHVEFRISAYTMIWLKARPKQKSCMNYKALCIVGCVYFNTIILLGQYIAPVIIGEPPPPHSGFTYNKATNNCGILYGGHAVYITKLTRNTVVS